MSVNTDVEELINYLESKDLEIVNHFKNVAQEKLYTSRNMSLLGLLLDRYIQTKSDVLLELLVGVNDISSMYLFDRLNDHLKHGAYNEVCTILFSVVKKQPSWLHKIVGTSLFATFLKCLKNESDIVFIMRGILILCSLIPCVPAIIGPYHGDLLEVFVRTAGFIANKSTGTPEVCILHLNVGIYIFFQRLYTMYPNNFLSYMKSCFGGNRRKDPVFQEVIKPMFEFVKFHPDLITDTSKSETGLEKWKVYQPHDVLAECQKISLDQTDLVKEATYAVYDLQCESLLHPPVSGDANSFSGLNSYFVHPHSLNNLLTIKKDVNNHGVFSKDLERDLELYNPSEICGLTTPPSMTPSSSMHDISSLQGGSKPYDSDSKGSSQMLNDIAEHLRKSSGDPFSNSANYSPKPTVKKTKSFGSGDNFSHRTIMRSLLSNSTYHSTPIERKQTIHTSAPASPKKNNTPARRPQSTEFFRYKRDLPKQMELGLNMDCFSIQSAPSSPMVPSEPSIFSYNADADGDGKFKSHDELMETREKIKSSNLLACHSLNHDIPPILSALTDKHCKNNSDSSTNHHQFSIFKSIKEMFVEIFPKIVKSGLDSYDNIEVSCLPLPNVAKKRSPMNLLDDFIQYGSDIHSYHLSRVPLTSQLDTDWTYFGGTAPVDEIRILQTQVQLFYIQLQYERYKCELHCLRNRRLFGSLQKAQKAHEEVDALKDQIRLAETKMREMKLALEFKCEENREIKQQTGIREQEYMEKIDKLEELNSQLEYKLKNCKLKKKQEIKKNTILQQELQKVRYHLFDAKQNYAHIKPKIKQISHYQDVTNALEKELLILYEKQESLKDKMKERETDSFRDIDLEQKLVAHRHELRVTQEEKERLHVINESLKLKLNELEVSNSRKDSVIKDHKLSAKKLCAKHKAEIEALESRFECCRKTSQSLQSYIASLFAKLEQPRTCQAASQTHSSTISLNSHITSKCGDRCRKISYPGMGKSPISQHDHSHRHSMSSVNSTDNPFRCKKQLYEENPDLCKDGGRCREDSGIGRSDDVSRCGDITSEYSSPTS